MISKTHLHEGLAAHIIAHLMIDTESTEEVDGVNSIAEAALDFFTASVRGAPATSAPALLWAIYSGILENTVSQEKIDSFFSNFNLDIPKIIQTLPDTLDYQLAMIPKFVNIDSLNKAVSKLPADEIAQGVSVLVVPGKLTEATIADIVKALYQQMQGSASS